MSVSFDCDNCGKTIKAKDDLVGKKVKCPKCAGLNVVPDDDGANEENTKKCPFCSEDILETAKKCKHCGEFIDGDDEGANNGRRKSKKNPKPICLSCGHEGNMPKRYPVWVIICAIVFFPLGLILLCLDKKRKCPRCGEMQP